MERNSAIFGFEHAAVILSGSKTLLWSEVQRFSASNMLLLISLWIEAALKRNSANFRLRTCSCFFSLDCFRAKIQRIFSRCFFSLDRSCFRAKFNEFSASNMQLFFSLWIEDAALERNSANCWLRTCSCFFSHDRSCFRAKFSEFSASNMQLFFSLLRKGCFLERFLPYFAPCSNPFFLLFPLVGRRRSDSKLSYILKAIRHLPASETQQGLQDAKDLQQKHCRPAKMDRSNIQSDVITLLLQAQLREATREVLSHLSLSLCPSLRLTLENLEPQNWMQLLSAYYPPKRKVGCCRTHNLGSR